MIFDLQKADFWKRISAALFDLIMLGIVVIGIAWGLSAALKYDDYKNGLDACYEQYEKDFGIDFDITSEDYEKLDEAEKAKYQAASDKIKTDTTTYYFYSMTVNLTLIIVIFSVLISYLLMEFVIPLIFGNGQTLGKKIFGIAVMRADGVKVTPLMMFVRTVLGKCTVETLVPILVLIMIIMRVTGIFGLFILFVLLLAQIILLFVTKARTPIHDLMANSVTVDIASQMIFDTPEALLEYKQRMQEEKAKKAEYF